VVILEADLEEYPGMYLNINQTHKGFMGVYALTLLRASLMVTVVLILSLRQEQIISQGQWDPKFSMEGNCNQVRKTRNY